MTSQQQQRHMTYTRRGGDNRAIFENAAEKQNTAQNLDTEGLPIVCYIYTCTVYTRT